MQNKTSTQECFQARPQSDSEIAAKFAVLFQARRNKLGLQEGEDDTMEVLSWDVGQEILKELAQLFHARPDQRLKRAADEERWRNRQTRGNMLNPPEARQRSVHRDDPSTLRCGGGGHSGRR